MKKTVFLAAAFSLAGNPLALAEDAAPTVSVKLLSTALANQAVAAALQECSGRGFQVAASLVGRDGNLEAFLRDPLAGKHTIEISIAKANTAASLRVASGELPQMSDLQGLQFAEGLIFLKGGLPIDVAGVFYGGIAVSGATPAADEECARAGIDAITETLEFAE